VQLQDYWNIVAKRWWIILLVAVVAVVSAYVYSKSQQPIFRSSARLYVMPARPDYGNVLFISNVVRQYSQLIVTDRFLNAVNEKLNLDMPSQVLKTKVYTSGTADNLAVQIEVDNPDPAKAQDIVRALTQEFMEDQAMRMQNVDRVNRIDVRMYDEPAPAVLVRPKTRVNVIAGGVLGFLLGAIIAFVLEYLDDTIKNSADVERYVALPVVGNIPTITP